MKKQIILFLILLFACLQSAEATRKKKFHFSGQEKPAHSLIEKYIPGARFAKKVLYMGVVMFFFAGPAMCKNFNFSNSSNEQCNSVAEAPLSALKKSDFYLCNPLLTDFSVCSRVDDYYDTTSCLFEDDEAVDCKTFNPLVGNNVTFSHRCISIADEDSLVCKKTCNTLETFGLFYREKKYDSEVVRELKREVGKEKTGRVYVPKTTAFLKKQAKKFGVAPPLMLQIHIDPEQECPSQGYYTKEPTEKIGIYPNAIRNSLEFKEVICHEFGHKKEKLVRKTYRKTNNEIEARIIGVVGSLDNVEFIEGDKKFDESKCEGYESVFKNKKELKEAVDSPESNFIGRGREGFDAKVDGRVLYFTHIYYLKILNSFKGVAFNRLLQRKN